MFPKVTHLHLILENITKLILFSSIVKTFVFLRQILIPHKNCVFSGTYLKIINSEKHKKTEKWKMKLKI